MTDSLAAHCAVRTCELRTAALWVPLCEAHMIEAWRWVEANPGIRPAARVTSPSHPRNVRTPEADHVVYYALLPHGDIKIGVTYRLKERIRGLRLSYPEAVLAFEPGGYDLERERHQQFHAERRWLKGRPQEDFAPSRKLLDHIKIARVAFGAPPPR